MLKTAFLNQKLRAWYSHRQGLDGSLKGASPAKSCGDRDGRGRSEVLDRTSRCFRAREYREKPWMALLRRLKFTSCHRPATAPTCCRGGLRSGLESRHA